MSPNPIPTQPRRAQTRPEGRSDEELVAETLDGNRGAFERLVQRHQRGLVNHLYRHTGQRDGAADLAQEAFLKVYLSLAKFDPSYRFTTWLYRIASNCAIDHLRKKKPPTCSLEADPEQPDAPGVNPVLTGSEPSPDEVVRLHELEHRLDVAVRALPRGYRELILLRHRQHCRYDEISRITRLPLGTVKNRIFRAREMLRHELADLLNHAQS